MDLISQALKKKKNAVDNEGTLEISLQFKKLTNNPTTSFKITFGLQCITDKTIHVYNTQPQCTDWSLTEHLNKA